MTEDLVTVTLKAKIFDTVDLMKGPVKNNFLKGYQIKCSGSQLLIKEKSCLWYDEQRC